METLIKNSRFFGSHNKDCKYCWYKRQRAQQIPTTGAAYKKEITANSIYYGKQLTLKILQKALQTQLQQTVGTADTTADITTANDWRSQHCSHHI